MSQGRCERLELKDINELAKVLTTLNSSNALAYGIPEHAQATIVTKKELAKIKDNGGPPTIARTRDFFQYAKDRSIFMIDYDPEKGKPPMTGEAFLEAVYSVCPEIRDAPHLLTSSASAFIYNDAECLKGPGGWRLLVVVAHGSDIPRAGDTLFKRGWLAGFGNIVISKSGAMLPRCKLLDASVFQPERLDFCGPPAMTPPLTQKRPGPQVFNAVADPLDTAQALKSLTLAEEAEFAKLKESALNDARPESKAVQAQWVTDRLEATLAEENPAPEDLEARTAKIREVFTIAVTKKILMRDFVLQQPNGITVTISEALDNPDKWHGQRFHDPLEPDYGGNDGRIAVLNLRASGSPTFTATPTVDSALPWFALGKH